MLCFKILNIRFRIDFFFLAFLAVFFSTKYYKIACAVVLASVIHEIVHIVFIYFFGGKLSEIRFFGFGITMKTRNDAFISRGKSTVIALSAPIFNILLGTAMIFLGQSMFGYVNLVIGAWNILPIKGLDGRATHRVCVHDPQEFSMSGALHRVCVHDPHTPGQGFRP